MVVLTTILFCFAILLLLHIKDHDHTKYTIKNFVKSHIKMKKKPITILKPETDDSEYKYLELPNKMKVLLISDPNVN